VTEAGLFGEPERTQVTKSIWTGAVTVPVPWGAHLKNVQTLVDKVP